MRKRFIGAGGIPRVKTVTTVTTTHIKRPAA